MRGVLASLLLATAVPPASATLELIDGTTISLDTLRGRVVVLEFWATWCAPCRAELADLDRFVLTHRGDVVAVAVLAERRPDARLVAATAAALRLPVARRLMAGSERFPLPGQAVPTTYVLDRTGRVAFVKTGPFAPGELAARLAPLIAGADARD